MAITELDYFQEYLDKYPWIFHLDGNKKNVGYFVFFLLHAGYIVGTYFELRFVGLAEYAWDTTVFVGIALAVFTFIRYKLLVNNYNTVLIFLFGISFVRNLVDIFRSSGGYSFIASIGTVYNLLVCIWFVFAAYIRKSCMEKGCRDYKLQLDHNAAADSKTLFKEEVERDPFFEEDIEEVQKAQAEKKTFLDKEPNWNSKVTIEKSTTFCPKCGFGIVPGEHECHVCGFKLEVADWGEEAEQSEEGEQSRECEQGEEPMEA